MEEDTSDCVSFKISVSKVPRAKMEDKVSKLAVTTAKMKRNVNPTSAIFPEETNYQ